MANPAPNAPGGPQGPTPGQTNPPGAPSASQLAAKHTAPAAAARPVGRPPGTGKNQIAQGTKPADAGNLPPAFDPGIVRRALESMCKTVDGIGKRKVYRTALALTKSDSLAHEFAQDVMMQPEEIDTIASLGETVATQYALLGQHSPAVLLGVAVIGVGARYAFVLNKLGDLERMNAAAAAKAVKEGKADAPKPPTQ